MGQRCLAKFSNQILGQLFSCQISRDKIFLAKLVVHNEHAVRQWIAGWYQVFETNETLQTYSENQSVFRVASHEIQTKIVYYS